MLLGTLVYTIPPVTRDVASSICTIAVCITVGQKNSSWVTKHVGTALHGEVQRLDCLPPLNVSSCLH